MTTSAIYPFGRPSKPSPPRKPEGATAAFVLGVYPSALHVRWTLPTWAVTKVGATVVGALAVDDEPTALWDGGDAEAHVQAWADKVGFLAGDGDREWGSVSPAGNGTSGRAVVERILDPLDISPDDVWCTDVVNHFFVKRAGPQSTTREQGDLIDRVYAPFAEQAVLPRATLLPRPTLAEVLTMGTTEHRDRLRAQLTESQPPLVITLGEEARQVLLEIVDEADGAPTVPLTGDRFAGEGEAYGAPGALAIGDVVADWMALIHPRDRSEVWRDIQQSWIERQSGD